MTQSDITPRFSMRSFLSASFVALAANFVPFMLVGLIVFGPMHLYSYVSYDIGATDQDLTTTLVLAALKSLAGIIVMASLIFATIEYLSGRRATISRSLVRAFGLIFPLLTVTIVVVICVGLAIAAGGVLGRYLLGSAAGVAPFWMLIFIVPGFIVAALLWVAVPVAIVERPGTFQSLGRSVELTKGHRLPLAIILLAIYFFCGIAYYSIVGNLEPERVLFRQNLLPLFAAYWIANAFFVALVASLAGASYYFLRNDKERAKTDQTAEVFD